MPQRKTYRGGGNGLAQREETDSRRMGDPRRRVTEPGRSVESKPELRLRSSVFERLCSAVTCLRTRTHLGRERCRRLSHDRGRTRVRWGDGFVFVRPLRAFAAVVFRALGGGVATVGAEEPFLPVRLFRSAGGASRSGGRKPSVSTTPFSCRVRLEPGGRRRGRHLGLLPEAAGGPPAGTGRGLLADNRKNATLGGSESRSLGALKIPVIFSGTCVIMAAWYVCVCACARMFQKL